jgi:hypothetical protein
LQIRRSDSLDCLTKLVVAPKMSVFVSAPKAKQVFVTALSMEPDAARNEMSHLSTKSAKGYPMAGHLTANAELFC